MDASPTWQPLAFVEGRGTTTEAQHYTYRAAGLAPGRHRFRLRQVDFDGRFEYSSEVEVTVAVPAGYVLSDVYPNPFNPQAAFTLALRQAEHVRVEVVDALGRRVAVLHEGPVAAGQVQRFAIDGRAWASGTYLVRVLGETFTETRTVTIAK